MDSKKLVGMTVAVLAAIAFSASPLIATACPGHKKCHCHCAKHHDNDKDHHKSKAKKQKKQTTSADESSDKKPDKQDN